MLGYSLVGSFLSGTLRGSYEGLYIPPVSSFSLHCRSILSLTSFALRVLSGKPPTKGTTIETEGDVQALIIRIGFSASYTIFLMRNPQNSIGNY